MNRSVINVAWVGLLFLTWNCASHAESADREKPIHLESDRVMIDDVKQMSFFEGEVQLNQGTLAIRAERIVVTQDKLGYKHCTATGRVASFRQKHEGSDKFMEGYGERIEYDTRAETVDFFGQARVKREQDDVRGDYITYSTKTEIFQVRGKPGVNPEEPSQGRVHAVLNPKSKEKPRSAAPAGDTLSIQPSSTLTQPKR